MQTLLVCCYREEHACRRKVKRIIKIENCVSTPVSVCGELFDGIRITPGIVPAIPEVRFPYVMKRDMDIYNTKGQLIMTGSYNTSKINVSNLAAGMYPAVFD